MERPHILAIARIPDTNGFVKAAADPSRWLCKRPVTGPAAETDSTERPEFRALFPVTRTKTVGKHPVSRRSRMS